MPKPLTSRATFVRLSALPRQLWPAANLFLERNGPRYGAALAFYTVFSLAPLLVVVTAGIAMLLGTEAAQQAINDYVLRILGPEEARILVGMLQNALTRLQGGGSAAWIALGSTLVGAGAAFLELKAALQSIWNVPPPPGSSLSALVLGRLGGLALALGIGFLLGVTLIAETAVHAVLRWLDHGQLGLDLALGLADLLLMNAFSAALFALLLARLAPVWVGWRQALPAALLITVLFAFGRYLIAAYLTQAGVASAYGAAGSLAAVLVWCYASAQIFLYGACVMYVQQAAREGRGSDGKPIARHSVADGRLHPADPES